MQNILVKWADQDQRIVLIDIQNQQWTTDEIFDAIDEAGNLIASVDHPYVTVTDTSASGSYVPPNFIASFPRIMTKMERSQHDRGMIIVARSGMNKIASEIFSRAMRRMVIVDNMDAALEAANQRLAAEK